MLLLILHIITAITSVVCALVGIFMPSKFMQYANALTTSAVVVSGIGLVLELKTGLLTLCLNGLLLVSFSLVSFIYAQRKLQAQTQK